ncbi:MAG: DNA integrity scanning protein DisA nucleotide-binding domain protein [Pseudomonadota bacterium]
MRGTASKNLCLYDILDGLRDGLSHFSPPSRAALVYTETPASPLLVCDPQNLLRGHEPRLKELFLDSDAWRRPTKSGHLSNCLEELRHEELQDGFTGLISFSGRAKSVFFQAWFTEEHPDLCSTGPTQRWLEYAARMVARNFAFDDVLDLGDSGYVLQEYAAHAIRDHIIDERNILLGPDSRLRVFPILDAVIGLSKTEEEGAWPRGELWFVEPRVISTIGFMTRFPELECPEISNFKHVRKMMLAVEDSSLKLISDGRGLLGLTADTPPRASLGACFHGSHGFLKLDDRLVCSFSDGRFHSTNRKPNLVLFEEALLEKDLDPAVRYELYRMVGEIVQSAGEGQYGCALVVDLSEEPVKIAGQKMEFPLDLRDPRLFQLAKSLAKVDGALHLGKDLHLHGFACLMDGRAITGENRARGARFNSSLRFSAEHPDLIVVVVSSDRPVSVIQGGLDLSSHCEWRPLTGCAPLPTKLRDWING